MYCAEGQRCTFRADMRSTIHRRLGDATRPNRPVTPSDTTTIQVKLPGQKLIVKLRFNDTIGGLRACIDKHMSAGSGSGKLAYKLQNSYPRKQLADNAATLLDEGLTPSATIHLIPLK